VTLSLVSGPAVFCWVLSGRTPRSLGLFVSDAGVGGSAGDVVAAIKVVIEQLAAELLLDGVLRAGNPGDVNAYVRRKLLSNAMSSPRCACGNLGSAKR
jgi:hypothetical protein